MQPVQVIFAHDDFGLRAALVQQRGRFQCALTPSDDQYAGSGEAAEVLVIPGVRRDFGR